MGPFRLTFLWFREEKGIHSQGLGRVHPTPIGSMTASAVPQQGGRRQESCQEAVSGART